MVCLNPYSLNSLRGVASWTPLHSEKKTSPTWIAKTAKTSGSEMNPFGSFFPTGSMGLFFYLRLVDFYGKCVEYTIHGSYGIGS